MTKIARIVLLATTAVHFAACGTVESAGQRIDVSVDKAADKLQVMIDAAAARGSEMIKQAAVEGAATVNAAVTHARVEAQALVKESTAQVSAEARITLDRAANDLRELSRDVLTRVGDLLKIAIGTFEDSGHALVAQMIRGFEKVVKDGLDRVETKTLPAAKEQTVDLIAELGKWWDKIAMAVLTIAGGVITLRARAKAAASGRVADVARQVIARAGNGGAGTPVDEHLEAVIRQVVPTKMEGQVREFFRTAERPKTGTGK